MRNRDDRAIRKLLSYYPLHERVRVGVNVAGNLVEHYDLAFSQDGARQAEELTLTMAEEISIEVGIQSTLGLNEVP